MSFQQLLSIIPIVEHVASYASSRKIECSPGTHVLLVVRLGHVTIDSPDQEPLVCTAGFACHPHFAPYTVHVPKTKEAEYTVITYRVLPENSLWTLHGPLSTISAIKIHYMLDELIRTIDQIQAGSEEEAASHRFRMRAMLERVLFIFLHESRIKDKQQSTSETIDETLSYINEHYMNKLTLPMMAERAGLSEGHYTVLFKKHTGTTMTRYLRRIRIEKAKLMFQQTRLSAKEVAHNSGFSDYFHFSRVFKQEVGCSPAAYLRSLTEI
ncbi:AraC family transcriptional regulator [Cohnella cholangitidis]|uniref:Helix-turn-helix transcriptional regulator n=1 Tax=Cohnella cholangitidis TaxID=2598458 RepID=A0A7G5C0S6_9BACL|nr:AraC family transcriptional regulator [Cohnella cholangitidis]QMV42810.1 helix-turn-helix transcriptional regulator [Cohnella cholangitidis]